MLLSSMPQKFVPIANCRHRFLRSALLTVCIAYVATPAVDIGGMTFAVDQADDWADPQASHHSRHALGGALLAQNSYLFLRLLGQPSSSASSSALGFTAVVGAIYELDNAGRFGSWVDPVDMVWNTFGALTVFASYRSDDMLLCPILSHDRAGLALAWEF
jgi:hypothetical protein